MVTKRIKGDYMNQTRSEQVAKEIVVFTQNKFEIQREIEERFKDWKSEDEPRPLKEFIEEIKELVE
jgi:hypothetical protein